MNYLALLQEQRNYIAVTLSFMGHYQFRSLFITKRVYVLVDTGFISIFTILTFYRMLNDLFDDQLNCLLTYENMKADIFDSIFRIIMNNAGLYLSDYFNQKKMECLRNLAEEIEKKSKEKERFFACVSHELRNPLNSLLASIEILATTSKSKQIELLSSAKACGDTLLHLIGNILDVTKIKDQKMELNIISSDIKEIIHKVIMMHKMKAKNKGLSLEFLGDPTIPPCVKVDPEKITQILINLISNSIKFTERGKIIVNLTWAPILVEDYSSLDIEFVIEEMANNSNRDELLFNNIEEIEEHSRIRDKKDLAKKLKSYGGIPKSQSDDIFVSGPWIQYEKNYSLVKSSRRQFQDMKRSKLLQEKGVLKIEIIDSGIGISAENINKLFQPFTQADKSISQKFGGTGLGLWIAKSIIEMIMMGGCIRIESEIDQGTNFMRRQNQDSYICEIPEDKRIPIMVLTGEPSAKEKTNCLNILKANAFLLKPISLHHFHKSIQTVLKKEESKSNIEDSQKNVIRTILLVEDDKLLSNLIRQFLEGYEVIQAYTIEDGKQKFMEYYSEIYAVCLDGNLGDGIGTQFLGPARKFEKEVKGVPKEKMIKVISTSGDPIRKQKKLYANLYVSQFVEKPFSKNALLNAIKLLQNEDI